MALPLGISTVFSPAFVFSPSIPAAIYTAAKPAFANSLRSNSLAVGVYSIVGAIALAFLTDNIGVQRNSVFDNGDFLQKALSSLQRPTATRMPNSTPSLLSPECLRTKQIFAVVAIICAYLIGFAYVMYLGDTSQNSSSSSSSEPARNHQRFIQRDRRRDPAPWPLPPPSRRPSGSQPPNRNRREGSMDGRPRQGNTQNSQLLRRPPREDPPPPPPPSLAGFIQDFPVPQNFEEFISMNMWLGAICGWILKKLIGYFRGRNSSQKPAPSSLPKRIAGSIPRKTGDRSRPTDSRSRLPKRRQTPLPLDLRRSKHPVSIFYVFTLAGPGSLVLCRLRARRRATKVEAGPNLPIPPPLTVVRSRNPYQDSSLAYAVLQEHNSPAPNRLPRSQSTPPSNRRQPSRTRRSPNDQVRLSKIEQVKYFYKDEIIGFENGPPPRTRKRSSSVS